MTEGNRPTPEKDGNERPEPSPVSRKPRGTHDERTGEPLERGAEVRRRTGTPGRRAEDLDDEGSTTDRRDAESLMGKTRKLAGKYGKPLIGLGVAGIAMPIAHELDNVAGAHQHKDTGKYAPGTPTSPSVNVAERSTPAAAGSSESREDTVAQHWATLHRSNLVQTAMSVFGIDEPLSQQIHDAALKAGIDPELGYGLVHTESTFKTTAKSYVGALGLTQLMPRTAAWLQPGTTKADLVKPDINLSLGFKYLKSLIDRYNGNTKLALTAYNRGPGIVDHVLKRGGDPDNGYAGKVLGGAGRVQS